MKNRRDFLKQSIYGGVGIIGLSSFSPLSLMAKDQLRLSILHTNDLHSHIDPFPLNDARYGGKGGLARIATLVKRIRQEEKNVLLLDAGDIFQGTPYFNIFGGELEFKMMSEIGYDASTMGNHDFDNGIQGFDKMLPLANFPFLCGNYNFDNTILQGKTEPYKVFEKEELKIGVFGVGIELDGLVDHRLYAETEYLDPIFQANKYAYLLKKELKCDLVVCLSHLGFSYKNDKVSDKVLASQSEYIDIIIGGHTHTFLDEPFQQKNINDQSVLIHQVGWAGINLGRIDVVFEKSTKKNSERKRTYNAQYQ